MSAGKIIGIIGAGLVANELTKGAGNRSANVGDASVNSNVVDLLVQRIKTDAHLQSILRGPAGGPGSGGTSVAAHLEILGQGLRMSPVPGSEAPVGDHQFYVLIGETAGGVTDGTDILVKVDISDFYLKGNESLVISNDLFGDSPILDSEWGNVSPYHVIENDRNPDGTPYVGDPSENVIPEDSRDWSYEGREGDILTYKLGGVRKKNGFGPFMRSAFVLRMYKDTGIQSPYPTEECSIGIEISGGGMAEPVTGSIVVPLAFYV